MSPTYRNLLCGVFVAALPLFAGCCGCMPQNATIPNRTNDILADTSLSDREFLKELGSAVFKLGFGDSANTNINKGQITLFLWEKEFHHEALEKAKDVLGDRANMPEENKVELQKAKAYAYRQIAKHMEEFLGYVEDRPLKGIVYRLAHMQYKPRTRSFMLLELRITSDKFAQFRELVGEKGAKLKGLDDAEVIETLDTMWEVQTDGFPKVSVEAPAET